MRSNGIPDARFETGPACAGCSWRSRSQGYTEGCGPLASRIVVVAEAAGPREVESGVPFSGPSGYALNEYLEIAGLSRFDVRLENVVRCRPLWHVACEECGGNEWEETAGNGLVQVETGDRDAEPVICAACSGVGWIPYFNTLNDYKTTAPPPEQIEECMRRYGNEQMRRLRPSLFVALGESALYGMTGKSGVGTWRGSVIDGPFGRVFSTYNPAFVMRVQENKPIVQRDFARIPSVLLGHEDIDVSYEVSSPALYGSDVWSAAVDFETSGGLDPRNGKIQCMSVSPRAGESRVYTRIDDMRIVLAQLEEVIGHYYYQYDAWWSYVHGLPVPDVIRDTQVLAHLANPCIVHDLETTQSVYAEPPMGSHWKTPEAYGSDKVGVAAQDTDATFRSDVGLEKHLRRTGQWDFAVSNCIPMARVAYEMRAYGIRVNPEMMLRESERVHANVVARGAALAKDAGIELPKKTKTGLPSSQALQGYLYGRLGLRPKLQRKTGRVTTDERSLIRIRAEAVRDGRSDLVAFLTEFLELKKASTLAKDFGKYIMPDAITGELVGRLHPEWNLTGTKTGRLSAARPGVHQVPLSVREAFLPEPGHVFVGGDYSQMEFIVMLLRSREWELLRLALAGQDFHIMAASLFFQVPPADVTPAQRKAVKPINFGIIYGKGVESTAEDLDRPYEDVQRDFDAFFAMVPGLLAYRRELRSFVEANGYWQTPLGWRLMFTPTERTGRFALPEIYNQPIQSEAGCVTRLALVRAHDAMQSLGGHVVLTVHDSIVATVPEERAFEAHCALEAVMREPIAELACDEYPNGISFPVKMKTGRTWKELG